MNASYNNYNYDRDLSLVACRYAESLCTGGQIPSVSHHHLATKELCSVPKRTRKVSVVHQELQPVNGFSDLTTQLEDGHFAGFLQVGGQLHQLLRSQRHFADFVGDDIVLVANA